MTKYRFKSVISTAAIAVLLVGLAGAPVAAARQVDRRPLLAGLLVHADLPRSYHSARPSTEVWADIPPANFGPCGDAPSQAGAPTRTRLAVAAFVQAPANTTNLIETLAVVGDSNARAAVAASGSAWRTCPTTQLVTTDGTHEIVQIRRMATPRLGAVSAGLRYVIRLQSGGPPIQYAREIVVAWHGVIVKVALQGPAEPDRHELETIAARAVAKLQRIR